MKTIGILGGLGPLAGAFFYRRLIELTPVRGEEDHLPVVMVSSPAIPSRLAYLEGRGPSPLPALQAAVRRLEGAGADVIVMPSSTTHAFFPELKAASSAEWVNMIEEVSQAAGSRGVTRLALVATTPTITFHLYDDALRARGIIPLVPDDASQSHIMDVIAGVKNGEALPPLAAELMAVAERPWASGADAVVLACTETPVVFPLSEWSLRHPVPILSATDILASAAIRKAAGA